MNLELNDSRSAWLYNSHIFYVALEPHGSKTTLL